MTIVSRSKPCVAQLAHDDVEDRPVADRHQRLRQDGRVRPQPHPQAPRRVRLLASRAGAYPRLRRPIDCSAYAPQMTSSGGNAARCAIMPGVNADERRTAALQLWPHEAGATAQGAARAGVAPARPPSPCASGRRWPRGRAGSAGSGSVVEPLARFRRAALGDAAARRAAGPGPGRRVPPRPRPRLRPASSAPRPSAASTRYSPKPASPTCWRSRRTSPATTSTPAVAERRALDRGEIETLRALRERRRRLRPPRRRPPHPPRLAPPPLGVLRARPRGDRRADRRRPRDLRPASTSPPPSSSRPSTASTPPSTRCSPSASRSSAAAPRASACSASTAPPSGTARPSTCPPTRRSTAPRPRPRPGSNG